MPRRYGVIARWLLLAASMSCSPDNSRRVGGDTHWLTACSLDDDCGEHACLCGICTRRCSTDDACARGPEAACFDARSPSLLQRCEAGGAEAVGGICLAECASAADCREQQVCMNGACLRVDEVDAGRGGASGAAGAVGGAGSTSTAEPSVSSDDFEDVNVEVAWAEPITVPRPEPVFAGDEPDRLVGTWIEPSCDPGPMTAYTTGRGDGCFRFVIERSARGEVTGMLSFERTHDVPGPFAPATDPDVGYPTEVESSQYSGLFSSPPLGPYRMLDGRFENGRLTFWYSLMDFWRDWCALQIPYPWEIAGQTFHACVPQDAESRAAIDEGKLHLCAAFTFTSSCPLPDGTFYPCGCPRDTAPDPRCAGSACTCDATGCDANLQQPGTPRTAELTFDGERLTGTARIAIDFTVTMEREEP